MHYTYVKTLKFYLPGISDIARTLGVLIVKFVYWLMISLYNLFMTVSRVQILTAGDIEPIYQKITIILSVVMVFYVTFQTVKYVIQPDAMTDKETGASKIVTRMILVVLLLAMVPRIFTLAYKLQGSILDSGIFGKIFFVGRDSDNVLNYGNEFAGELLNKFYYVNPGYEDEFCNIPGAPKDESDKYKCEILVDDVIRGYREEGNSSRILIGLWSFDEDTNDYYINFDILLCIAVGGFVCYLLLLFCIDAGVRVAQLTFLQIIAPIPIIGYLSPKKDNMFEKWAKQCLTTYLDLFLRIMIIYVVFLITQVLCQSYDHLLDGIPNATNGMKLFVFIALIIGLFIFAKRAPKLLEELLPKGLSSAASGDFSLNGKNGRFRPVARTAGAAIGASKFGRNVGRRVQHAHSRNKLKREERKKNKERVKGDGPGSSAKERRKDAQQTKKDARALDEAGKRFKEAERRLEDAKNRGVTGPELERLQREADAARDNWSKINRETNKRGEKGRAWEQLQKAATRKRMAMDRHEAAKKRREELERAGADPALIAAAQNEEAMAAVELEKATAETNDAVLKYRKFQIGDGDPEQRKNRDAKKVELEEAKRRRAELERTGGDPETIAAAQRDLEAKQKAYDDAAKEYIKDAKKEDTQLRKAAEEAGKAEQAAIDDIKQYQQSKIVGLNSVGGALKDTAHEIMAGLKTTELKDVLKNQRQAEQEVIKSVDELYNYYDNGGYGGVAGTVDRTITQYEKKHGYETKYERTMLQTKQMEPEITRLEGQSTLIQNMSSDLDSSEDRLKSKVDELKLGVKKDTIKTGLKKEDGTDRYVEPVSPDETIGQVSRRYKGRASAAKTRAEEASRRLAQFEANPPKGMDGMSDTEKQKLIGRMMFGETFDYGHATQAQKDSIDDEITSPTPRYSDDALTTARRKILETERDKASKEEADAAFEAEQVQKYAARYEFSEILREFASGKSIEQVNALGIYDGVAVERIYNTLDQLRLMRNNPVIIESLRHKLGDAEFERFMSGNILSYDELDTINIAAQNAKAEYERSKAAIKEQKSTLEASHATQAQKAAHDYNPDGGSK